MRKLERHITKLLLNNDCVIVPGFGGFITHHISASYDEKSNVYLPPSRTIGFNPQLVMNDSLLVQEYANTYDISYPEALKCIEMDVDNFKDTINQAEGGYEIRGIGRIYLLDDGQYDFLPNSSGITTPRNYGFSPIEIPLLSASDNVATTQTDELQITPGLSEDTDKPTKCLTDKKRAEETSCNTTESVSVHIPLNVFHQIAAACIMLFILLSVPSRLGEAGTEHLRKSSIETNWLYEIMPKEKTIGQPSNLSAIHNNAITAFQSEAVSESAESAKKSYSIVLASRITENNANAYVQKLQDEGMRDTRVYKTGKMVKVIYKSFATRREANIELNKMKSNALFAGCWITEIK